MKRRCACSLGGVGSRQCFGVRLRRTRGRSVDEAGGLRACVCVFVLGVLRLFIILPISVDVEATFWGRKKGKNV